MGQTKTKELQWFRAAGSEVGLLKSPSLVAAGQEKDSPCPGRKADLHPPRQPGATPNRPLCTYPAQAPGSHLPALRTPWALCGRTPGCSSGTAGAAPAACGDTKHQAGHRAQGLGGRRGTYRGSPVAAEVGELQEAAGQRGAHPRAGAGRGALGGLRLCHEGRTGRAAALPGNERGGSGRFRSSSSSSGTEMAVPRILRAGERVGPCRAAHSRARPAR